ncbi:hypothetical protein [Deinococcus multiflagellatus]|uniref:Uncharacterized protein n=1 Tax=Deinococcus multiflagellatus TaxID=1656887 RepID=A0ABW1ZIM4_9DEIO|nr:hypothetical protein [Deinococcus multiflagellatus]MBZ9712163.1 hypothetical protein [Deinococcus multiflagellatus]
MNITARFQEPERLATTPRQLAAILRRLYTLAPVTSNNAYMGAKTVRFTARSGRREVNAEFSRSEWAEFAAAYY